MRKAAKTTLHDRLERGDVLSLHEDVGGAREVGFGYVGGLELDEHAHAAALESLLVKLGGYRRWLLGPDGGHDQEG